ncbi:MAG: sulfotransferase [Mesorhizobium sp.]|nr:sulfotransferase [Mesorhizobium sp.]
MANEPAPFIVGVGRSGTTLLRLMIDSHPAIAIPPETHFIPAIDPRADSEGFLSVVLSSGRWADFHLDAATFRSEILSLPHFTVSDGLRVFYRQYAERFQKTRWGDKTPPYAVHLGQIASLLPEARFIHVIRDGRDSALSYRGLWFGPGTRTEAHARMWRDRILTTRQIAAQHRLPYLELRFETLVRRPEASLRTVCDFIEVPFHADMLDYHHKARDRIGEVSARSGHPVLPDVSKEDWARIFSKTFEPPDETRIGVWRREMSKDDQETYLSIAGELLQELGYR